MTVCCRGGNPTAIGGNHFVQASHLRHGVGAALARALVQVATSQGADKIVAMVPDYQPQACATFAKLGFIHEATLKGHVRDIHGFKHDLMAFANDLSPIWAPMEALTADYSPTLGSLDPGAPQGPGRDGEGPVVASTRAAAWTWGTLMWHRHTSRHLTNWYAPTTGRIFRTAQGAATGPPLAVLQQYRNRAQRPARFG